MKRRSRIVSSTVGGALMTLHDCGRATLLALAMLLAGCNQKQMYLPLPPAEVRIAQLILLIALSAKNAILIVGFARDLHLKDGLPLTDATIEAARLRLRPIVMTSLAFILGLLPPTHRKSIGPATLTGMMGSPLHAVVPDHMLTRDLAPGNIDNPLRAAAASARSTA